MSHGDVARLDVCKEVRGADVPGAPWAKVPPRGGMYKYPFPSQGTSRITCEPVPAAQMLKMP